MKSEEDSKTVVLDVEIEQDPLAPTKAQLVEARIKAASMQTDKQLAASKAIARDWVDEAKELGLALYERQPEENDLEWYIWTTFRGHYPGRMPTMTSLAKQCGSTVATVAKCANKWKFRMRMVEWSNFTDAGIQEKRIKAIREMNDSQLKTAQTLREKIAEAVDYLDPATLKPSELAQLMKLANETERTITEYREEKVEGQIMAAADAHVANTKTDASQISEVLGILAAAGALGAAIGVERKTVTTERVLVKGSESNE